VTRAIGHGPTVVRAEGATLGRVLEAAYPPYTRDARVLIERLVDDATYDGAHLAVVSANLFITEHRAVSDPRRLRAVMSIDLDDPDVAAPLVPGADERNTLTYRQTGAMGVDPSVTVPAGSSSMDAATIAEREREGGGSPSERRRQPQIQAQPRTGPAHRGSESKGFWLTGGFLWFQILRLARR
jgi:hypothetical protein